MPESTQHETIIAVEKIKKNFLVGKNIIHALRGISLEVKATDFLVIYGPSGCGKSTLLNIVLGLDPPTEGEIEIRRRKIYTMSEDERAAFRAKKIGMIYQMPYWIKSLNVIENIALPLIIDGLKEEEAVKYAKRVAEEIGIIELSSQIPTQLSGGQQQKVGLARALITNPWIIMADEPTGNLDTKSGNEILEIFKLLNQKYKRTIILVTHNQAYWESGTRRIEMRDGLIVKDTNHNNSNLISQNAK